MIAIIVKRNFSNAMGRSQVVRQRFLIPPPVGSNPAAPTNPRRILSAYFVSLRILKAQCM